MKLQAFAASDRETLQSQNGKNARNRLSLSRLHFVHGRLKKRAPGAHPRLFMRSKSSFDCGIASPRSVGAVPRAANVVINRLLEVTTRSPRPGINTPLPVLLLFPVQSKSHSTPRTTLLNWALYPSWPPPINTPLLPLSNLKPKKLSLTSR